MILGRLRQRLAGRAARLALIAEAAGQHRGAVPDLEGTIEVETSFGTLYLEESDPVITRGLLDVGEWEPGQTALLGGYLRPGMTVVDVGAHAGYYACLAGRLVGPRGLVLAFEPAPRNYELLLANVWRNGLTNVVCFPWAVSDANGFARLSLSTTNSGDHRLARIEGLESVAVRSVALDSLEALRPPVDVLKVDVQGVEEAVLRGARELLAASPDVLVTVEYAPGELDDPVALLERYRSLGWSLRVQHPNERGVRELADDEILAYCAEHEHTNLVLTRSP